MTLEYYVYYIIIHIMNVYRSDTDSVTGIEPGYRGIAPIQRLNHLAIDSKKSNKKTTLITNINISRIK